MKLPCELIRDLLPLYAEHLGTPDRCPLYIRIHHLYIACLFYDFCLRHSPYTRPR